MQRQILDSEEIFKNLIFDKVLMSKIYKELNNSKKKTKKPQNKQYNLYNLSMNKK